MICNNCKKEIDSDVKFCNHCGTENIKRNRQEEVKFIYHKLAHKFHPDKASGDGDLMKKINEAYANGDLETLRFLYYGEKREDAKEPVSDNRTEYRAETEAKAETKEKERQTANDITPDNKTGLMSSIITLIAGYLLYRIFGLTLIIIFCVAYFAYKWFPKWYSEKKNVNVNLIKWIVWSNLVTWIFPLLGFTTSALAFFFSNRFPGEHKKFRTLAIVGLILSIASAYIGVDRGGQLAREEKPIYETVQPGKTVEDKNKTFSEENQQAVFTPTITPVVKKEKNIKTDLVLPNSSIVSKVKNNQKSQQSNQDFYNFEDEGNYPSLPFFDTPIIDNSIPYFYNYSIVYYNNRNDNIYTPVSGDLSKYSLGKYSAYDSLILKDGVYKYSLSQHLSGLVVVEAGDIGNKENLYVKDPGSCKDVTQDKNWFNKAGFKITLSNPRFTNSGYLTHCINGANTYYYIGGLLPDTYNISVSLPIGWKLKKPIPATITIPPTTSSDENTLWIFITSN